MRLSYTEDIIFYLYEFCNIDLISNCTSECFMNMSVEMWRWEFELEHGAKFYEKL